jgi:hypothetical protein
LINIFIKMLMQLKIEWCWIQFLPKCCSKSFPKMLVQLFNEKMLVWFFLMKML